MKDEEVLGINAEHFKKVGEFSGFKPLRAHRIMECVYVDKLLDPKEFDFRPRSQCEDDPSFKQIIPYLVIKYRDKFFSYDRPTKIKEARLRAKRSIGIGGHINRDDAEEGNYYLNGMMRELNEEVKIYPEYKEQIIGLLYEPDTPVGQVHLGVVHLFNLDHKYSSDDPLVEIKEDNLINPQFRSLDELGGDTDYENWSQLVINYLTTLKEEKFV